MVARDAAVQDRPPVHNRRGGANEKEVDQCGRRGRDCLQGHVNCGAHATGGVYQCGSVTFTNTTSEPLTIIGERVEVSGPNASDFGYNGSGFNIACDTGVTIPPGGFCGINVLFAPSAVGRRTATLNLFDGTSDQASRVRVAGRGLAP
jgi:hypothetical protein